MILFYRFLCINFWDSEQINCVNLWLGKQAIGFIFPIHYSEQINDLNLWLDKQAIGFIFPIHYSEQINFVNLCLDKSRHRIYLSDSLLKAIYKIYTLFLYNLHSTTNQYEIQIYFKKTLYIICISL